MELIPPPPLPPLAVNDDRNSRTSQSSLTEEDDQEILNVLNRWANYLPVMASQYSTVALWKNTPTLLQQGPQ